MYTYTYSFPVSSILTKTTTLMFEHDVCLFDDLLKAIYRVEYSFQTQIYNLHKVEIIKIIIMCK